MTRPKTECQHCDAAVTIARGRAIRFASVAAALALVIAVSCPSLAASTRCTVGQVGARVDGAWCVYGAHGPQTVAVPTSDSLRRTYAYSFFQAVRTGNAVFLEHLPTLGSTPLLHSNITRAYPPKIRATWTWDRLTLTTSSSAPSVQFFRARRPVATVELAPDSSEIMSFALANGPKYVAPGTWSSAADLPVRWAADVTRGTWTGDKLVLWSNRDAALLTADREAKTWTRVPSPLTPRAGPTLMWTGSEIVILGGKSEAGGGFGDGAAWNPATGTWRTLAESPLSPSTGALITFTGNDIIALVS